MNWLWQSLYHAGAMLWETFWALILGFSLSAFLQVFFRKEQITKQFGRTGLREVALAAPSPRHPFNGVTRRGLILPQSF
jgi:uncharacterized membrane protein YraQ (UPF0718 family)